MRQLFYVVVLLTALAGQVSGAVQALGIPLIWAIPAVGALELGGVVVLANADVRRRLGEKAHASRLLSAAIAAFAVAFNWLAHDNKLLAGFFAGMSALGYLVWLMHTENQRRDRLRAKGDLPPTTPAYEMVGHWVRHPWLTLRAKNLAKADPRLGLYTSIAAAKAEKRKERRTSAIAKVLHRKIRSAVDPNTADIAIAVYDLDEIALRLADGADYDGLTALVAQDLVPARIAGTGYSLAEVPQLPAAASVVEDVVDVEAVLVPAAEDGTEYPAEASTVPAPVEPVPGTAKISTPASVLKISTPESGTDRDSTDLDGTGEPGTRYWSKISTPNPVPKISTPASGTDRVAPGGPWYPTADSTPKISTSKIGTPWVQPAPSATAASTAQLDPEPAATAVATAVEPDPEPVVQVATPEPTPAPEPEPVVQVATPEPTPVPEPEAKPGDADRPVSPAPARVTVDGVDAEDVDHANALYTAYLDRATTDPKFEVSFTDLDTYRKDLIRIFARTWHLQRTGALDKPWSCNGRFAGGDWRATPPTKDDIRVLAERGAQYANKIRQLVETIRGQLAPS